MTYRLEILGGFRLSGPDGPVEVRGKKLRGLLAYLASAGPEAQTRGKTASVLWGSYFEEQARQNLRATLRRLRRLLGSAMVISEDDTLTLNPQLIECDATLFRSLAATGRPDGLKQAIELYRGDFLDGLDIPEAVWEDWGRNRRQEFRSLALECLLQIARSALTNGRGDECLAAATRAMQFDEFREDVHRVMMLALKMLNRRAEAHRIYELLEERLRDELGATPSEETSRLAQELKGAGSFSTRPKAPRRPVVAVLPFVDRSQGSEQSLFCDGVTEDVISELARFRDLRVIDSSSSFSFKGKRIELSALRDALKVDYVVQGSLRRYGGRIRLSVQLSDTLAGSQIWSERYDREAEEIFAVQDDLVRTISATLVGWLERKGRERARERPTSSLAAYECVIQGRRHFLRMLHDENRAARSLFERALALDLYYPAAYAWLSETHLGDWAGGWTPDPKHSLSLGYDYASQAVELDDTDSRTHTALGRACVWYGNPERARHHFDRALMLNPSDAWALTSSARCHVLAGEAENGLRQIKTANRLNPLGRYGYQLGIGYFSMHRYPDAARQLKSVKEPIDLVYAWLAASLAFEGKADEAADMAARFHSAFDRRCQECGVEDGQSVRAFLANRFPFRLEADTKHFFSGIEKAGIKL